jgi:hypothetical protein
MLLLTACSDGTDEADAWATDMCRSLGRFTETVQGITAEMQALETQTEMPVEEKKGAFVASIDEGTAATAALIEDLETTAVPDVEGAQDAVDTFIGQIEKMRTVFSDFSTRFGEIDTSKPKEAEEEANAAALEMQQEFLALQTESQGITGISPDLDNAINESAECQGVLGSQSPQ